VPVFTLPFRPQHNSTPMALQLHINDAQTQFSIVDNNQEIAGFKYNRQSLSVRINSGQKRVFFIKSAGLLQNRILLATEYGVEIAENHVKNRNKGFIQLGHEKFHYTFNEETITLLNKAKQPLLELALQQTKSIDNYAMSAILFSTAWLIDANELNAPRIGTSVATAHTA